MKRLTFNEWRKLHPEIPDDDAPKCGKCGESTTTLRVNPNCDVCNGTNKMGESSAEKAYQEQCRREDLALAMMEPGKAVR